MLSISDSRNIGNEILSERTEAFQVMLDALSKKKGGFTHEDLLIMRCLACSTDNISTIDAPLNQFIKEMRQNYDLTFPNDAEYEVNRMEYMADKIKDSTAVKIADLGVNKKINIIFCQGNSKADVITATEQYINKLVKSSKGPDHPIIIVVDSHESLKVKLAECNQFESNVHLTSISHGSDNSLGYKDLPETFKKAITTWLSTRESSQNEALLQAVVDECQSIDLSYMNSDSLEGTLEVFLESKPFDQNERLAGKFIDAMRGLVDVIDVEVKELAELVNDNESISRLRLLACTSAASNKEALEEHVDLGLQLPDSSGERFQERSTNMLYIMDKEDSKPAIKVAAIAKQIKREGVIIKGEIGIINPGRSGVLCYASEKMGTGQLYTPVAQPVQRAHGQGSARFFSLPMSQSPAGNPLVSAIKFIKLNGSGGLSEEAKAEANSLIQSLDTSGKAVSSAESAKAPIKDKYIQIVKAKLEAIIDAGEPSSKPKL